ncbi:hypothetical protein [Streptomyces sp. NPDC091371]|uniref:hypothetical protein n=1 Tax=Streptomyces sp. NPDC091371 TaxID=3155303 RepID=UPI003426F5D3
MLTDRDERALLAAAQNRISEPLRIGAALASVLAALTRRPRASGHERESVACQPTPTQLPTPLPTPLHR